MRRSIAAMIVLLASGQEIHADFIEPFDAGSYVFNEFSRRIRTDDRQIAIGVGRIIINNFYRPWLAFDLSAISLPITQATLSGEITALRPCCARTDFLYSDFRFMRFAATDIQHSYEEVNTIFDSPQEDEGGLLALEIFQDLGNGIVGEARIDNGIEPTNPDEGTPVGPFFQFSLDPGALEAARLAGTPFLVGFFDLDENSHATSEAGSVKGDLTGVMLELQTIPEPASSTLVVIGLVAVATASRRGYRTRSIPAD